jgi:5-formyltetrahydrofolate cyclo-ligase
MNESASKSQIRKAVRAQRAKLDAASRMAADVAVARQLEQIPELQRAQHFAVYWAVSGELTLLSTCAFLRRAGKHVYLPVCLAGKRLRFAPFAPSAELVLNRYGIPEPTGDSSTHRMAGDLDALLLPLTAFDRLGNRLGSGAGYYDRCLAESVQGGGAKPLCIGVGFALQEVAALPCGALDVRMDMMVTESETIRF